MNLPLLLAGPILRRVDTTTASVWLALRDPCNVVMTVWEGRAKSDEAIRSVVKELRVRLRRSGMRRLASAIRGQKRSYALVLKS